MGDLQLIRTLGIEGQHELSIHHQEAQGAMIEYSGLLKPFAAGAHHLVHIQTDLGCA